MKRTINRRYGRPIQAVLWLLAIEAVGVTAWVAWQDVQGRARAATHLSVGLHSAAAYSPPGGLPGHLIDVGIVEPLWSFRLTPTGLAVPGPDQLLISDSPRDVVWLANLSQRPITRYGRRIGPHDAAVVAGTGRIGDSGDGGPAIQAHLHDPEALSVDGQGNLFIAEPVAHRVREVDAATGIIMTVVSN